jgi:repressor LexA
LKNLTDIQAHLVAALRRSVEHGQLPPSYRELCAEFGWSSTGTVRDHLKALARKGYVELPKRNGGRVRLREPGVPVRAVPIIGSVTAGVPVMAEENVRGILGIPADWTRGGDHFALEVKGDSMQDVGILEGDCVIVRRQQSAISGDIVAATLDGETTLKRLMKRGNTMLLVPENPNYKPIEVKNESAMIHGIVVGLFRHYRNRRSAGSHREARSG